MKILRLAALGLSCLAVQSFTLANDTISPEELSFFETKIRPVLIRECYGCHSNKAGNVRGGLRLDSKELMLIGGSSGPAIVPGDLEESWLYNAITHQDYVMPPKRKLPQQVIDDFRQWIEMGAPDPRVNKVSEIKSSITDDDIREAKRTFWAYQSPVEPLIPKVSAADWPRGDIDRFVLKKLDEAGLTPTEDARPTNVLRRLSFDLVGFPPTPSQIESFTREWNTDPDRAVAKVVDLLLEQPQYGERWGRHWLDVARYAESTGREVNMTYPHAWRYRDYVIDSLNEDKPFDRFVQEQLAGDLLPARTDRQWAKNLVATTFLAVGAKNVNEQNAVQFAADLIDEQIDATTRVFLGTSVACARCHDHKFDAIPQTDYYAMAGIFRSMETYFGRQQSEYGNFTSAQAKRTSSLLILPVEDPNPFDKSYSRQELASLKQEITDKLDQMGSLRRNRSRLSADGDAARNAIRDRLRTLNELQTLSTKLGGVDESGNPRSYCMGVQESRDPVDARLLVRGEIDQPAQTVNRDFPQVLRSNSARIPRDSSGRLELARWIGSDENPLTARVMVNRIWQHLIGQGIVTSTENFGTTGQPPSHPELLDYLALRFIESDWSIKAVIRAIATSRTYRMASTFNERHHEYDPDNALLWRANPRRLDAEAIRDAMLVVSGEIDLERPRASEVARAGYTRVQGGRLGNPRELLARSQESMRGRTATGFRRGLGQRAFGGGRRFGRPQRGMTEDLRSALQNPLDMESASFRSVYLPIVRDEEPRSLEVFDFADSSTIIGTRESSNTANQALYMLNNGFVLRQSEAFARRVAESSSRPNEQIEYAFQLAYGRKPSSGERRATAAFVRRFSPSTSFRERGHATLAALCQSLFASAEFRYVD